MALRNRTILIDGQNGVIYTQTDTVANAMLGDVIASSTRRALPITIKAPGVPVQSVKATYGWGINSNTFITNVKMECVKPDPAVTPDASVAPSGRSLNINIRKVSAGVATILGTTSISAGSVSSSTDVNYNLIAGDNIYVDVVQTGNPNPGAGLKVTLFYYGGI
jgi:hypothetical protein